MYFKTGKHGHNEKHCPEKMEMLWSQNSQTMRADGPRQQISWKLLEVRGIIRKGKDVKMRCLEKRAG